MATLKELTDNLEEELMGPQRLEALSRLRSDISSFEATLRQKLQLGAPGGEFAKLKQIYSASQASGKIIEAIRAM